MGKGSYASAAGQFFRNTPDCQLMATLHLDIHMNVDKKLLDMNDTYLIGRVSHGQAFSAPVAWAGGDER